MPIKILQRLVRNSDNTAERTGGAVSKLLSGTSAALEYAANITAPTLFRSSLTISVFQAKRPTVLSARKRSARATKRRVPNEIEMIAFALPVEKKGEEASQFSFELLSTSLVPQEFPTHGSRSESVYARRENLDHSRGVVRS